MVVSKETEKPVSNHVEDPTMDGKDIEVLGDYSGAVKKSDPAEIKLVKKLDIRIMTILWAMYFLVSSC